MAAYKKVDVPNVSTEAALVNYVVQLEERLDFAFSHLGKDNFNDSAWTTVTDMPAAASILIADENGLYEGKTVEQALQESAENIKTEHDAIQAAIASAMLAAHPIGSIYMTVTDTSPATLFGGTWVQLKDRFLLGAGDIYTNGAIGGEATHVLVESELPAISGQFSMHGSGSQTCFAGGSGHFTNLADRTGYRDGGTTNTGVSRSYDGATFAFGNNGAHNNMPPYLAVYMWQRTA